MEEKGTGYQEEQVYDPQGNELGTWGVTRNNWDYVFIPLGARILAVTSSSGCCGSTGTTFLHANHLDSTTMTDYAGDVAEDLLLYPWGNRWTYAGQLNDEHFAGLHNGDDLKESPARTYVSPIGRWLTPDPGNAGADPSNPQSWNAYSYVLNNPATSTDPSGLDCLYLSSQSTSSITVATERGSCTGENGIYVNGTVDVNSFTYTGTELGYWSTNGQAGGAGVIDLSGGPSSDQQALQTLSLAGQMASAQLTSFLKAAGVAATAEIGGEFLGAALEWAGAAGEAGSIIVPDPAASPFRSLGAAGARLTRELMETTNMTAEEAIEAFKKGSILREFPSQYLRSSLDEIEAANNAGNPAARKALKLLFDRRFDR